MHAVEDRGSGDRAVEESADDGVERLARVLREADLDCVCRENLARAIETFQRLEAQRRDRRSLEGAYRSRGEILALLAYLDDLDAVMCPERDRSVAEETALVFDDIAEAARRGAAALRRLAPGSR